MERLSSVGNLVQSCNRRLRGAGAGVEKNLICREGERSAVIGTHGDGFWSREAALAEDQVHPLGPFDAALAAAAKHIDDIPLTLTDLGQVHRNRTGFDAVVCSAPVQVRDPRARHHGLGRRAAFVDAASAHVLPLNEGGLPSGAGQGGRERPSGLPGADDHRVVVFCICHY